MPADARATHHGCCYQSCGINLARQHDTSRPLGSSSSMLSPCHALSRAAPIHAAIWHNTVVAVKVVPVRGGGRPDAGASAALNVQSELARHEAESHLTANLRHPNIVQVGLPVVSLLCHRCAQR